jgi:uncharacterized protein YeaO (DUF488 family)
VVSAAVPAAAKQAGVWLPRITPSTLVKDSIARRQAWHTASCAHRSNQKEHDTAVFCKQLLTKLSTTTALGVVLQARAAARP